MDKLKKIAVINGEKNVNVEQYFYRKPGVCLQDLGNNNYILFEVVSDRKEKDDKKNK